MATITLDMDEGDLPMNIRVDSDEGRALKEQIKSAMKPIFDAALSELVAESMVSVPASGTVTSRP